MQGALPTLWLWWTGAALAQQGPALPPSFQDGWAWTPAGPTLGPLRDVAIDPARPWRWAVAGMDGQVWVSADEGATWRRALPGIAAASEGLGRSREAPGDRIEDLLSDIDVEAFGEADALEEDDLEEAAVQLEQALDELEDAALDEAFQREPAEDRGRAGPRTRLWFDGYDLVVGRPDGLFVSEDSGETWDRVFAEAVLDWTRTPRGVVIGTRDGARYAADGRQFFDRDDGTEGLELRALAPAAQGALYGAADEGLWYSQDGSSWAPLASFDEPPLQVAVDPDQPGRVWLALPSALWVSEDAGQTFRRPPTAPMPGVTALTRVGTLHWLAASADGAWETTTGGLSWLPLARGLADPDTWGLALGAGTVALASDEGLLRLMDAPHLAFDPDAEASVLRDELAAWIPRGALIGSAVSRRELTERSTGNLLLASALPRITLRGEHRVDDRLVYNAGLNADGVTLNDRGGSSRRWDRVWVGMVELRWAPVGKKGSAFDGLLDASEADLGVSLGGGDLGAGEVQGVRRGAVQYAGEVARRVGELYTARAQALQRRVSVSRAPLLQQVQLELHIAELEAHLDALTDGAVSAWNAPPPRRNP